jgi:hypothetical protein
MIVLDPGCLRRMVRVSTQYTAGVLESFSAAQHPQRFVWDKKYGKAGEKRRSGKEKGEGEGEGEEEEEEEEEEEAERGVMDNKERTIYSIYYSTVGSNNKK